MTILSFSTHLFEIWSWKLLRQEGAPPGTTRTLVDSHDLSVAQRVQRCTVFFCVADKSLTAIALTLCFPSRLQELQWSGVLES
jgi:hypothetical protein